MGVLIICLPRPINIYKYLIFLLLLFKYIKNIKSQVGKKKKIIKLAISLIKQFDLTSLALVMSYKKINTTDTIRNILHF